MRVLLVEDDPSLAAGIASALEEAGFLVEWVGDGESAWFKGGTETYSAVILDLGLPGLDGLTVLRRWRQEGRAFPVLILTARGDWSERVEGIDAGADDYLPKPFRMEELIARLRAILRRAIGQTNPLITLGSMTLDTRRMSVALDGNPIHLTPQEYRLVSYLAQHAGRVVSQLELTEQLYAQDFERDSNAVEVLIGRARKKLGNRMIETRRGFGYIIERTEP
ncbi:MAG: response regulator transcription factor [Gammaproteobacteria bacterium]|nr:response regulator transcription factor [Gammaproteobacteria bacterium]MBU1654365.1 response regulator transcription factor [Gammaproteobacteria bacterium]MBU1961992.1 response regulator transcription factor [Gammaproteobacteria bacterium]